MLDRVNVVESDEERRHDRPRGTRGLILYRWVHGRERQEVDSGTIEPRGTLPQEQSSTSRRLPNSYNDNMKWKYPP